MVIAIISILTGLLLPALSRAKSKTKAIACINNVRQHSLAILLYADDHQETLPPVALEQDGLDLNWAVLLLPYLRNSQVHLCATDTTSKFISYGLNEGIFVDLEDDPETPPQKLSSFQRTSRTITLGDLGTEDDLNTVRPDTIKMVPPGRNLDDDEDARPIPRHSGRCNLGFLDGHSEGRQLKTFYQNQQPLDRWFTGW
ncbi:MAG: prepilin-type N-terminal cleavage/methylation domain-containing protein [Verrucomicrobiales bacterium]